MVRTILLELNELNFDFVERYVARGLLGNFGRMLEQHGLIKTTSEERYEHWEPWIQWVTAHTGLTFGQHGVFRLGDITEANATQIWELLEQKGLKVAAFSPMNAANQLRSPAFFVPDPWTKTTAVAPPIAAFSFKGIVEAVNHNASGRLTPFDALRIMVGAARYARPVNYLAYIGHAALSPVHPWRRAVFLDLLLGDMALSLLQQTRPDFATVFLNGGAHIQHHYMFSSSVYEGEQRNPSWYIPPGVDPVFAIYQVYDRLIGELRRQFPEARLMVATGLHQVPHAKVTYYWRLRDHAAFLTRCQAPFARVEPRMSRDFVVYCASAAEARAAQDALQGAKAGDGAPLFSVDNRGSSLFVELTYDLPITEDTHWWCGERVPERLAPYVAFVAIKNGEHDGNGYLIDSTADNSRETTVPLTSLVNRIAAPLAA